ncbi:MAG: DUF4157 domain-containing protein [Symploca sp. SIO1B1]|nr:DUF4157 domain-containing protein [Symploca sp. SIO1B1]
MIANVKRSLSSSKSSSSPNYMVGKQLQAPRPQVREANFAPVKQLKAPPRFSVSTKEVAQKQEEAIPNKTGLPDNLKTGIENLSGFSLNDVRVHYNSPKPAQLKALAYTQGRDIHVATGQEKHLPHEAWHVVQQMQGRVKPTMQMKGVQLNDDEGLEKEADLMGGILVKMGESSAKEVFYQSISNSRSQKSVQQTVQRQGKGKKSKHDRKAGRRDKFLAEERSIPQEEEKGYSISFESKTINPYTPAEIEEILANNSPGSLFEVNPHRIRTMHTGISDKYSDGSTIEDTVQQLRLDPTAIRHIPPIMVAALEIPQGFDLKSRELYPKRAKQLMLFTEDHRRVVAARLAGIEKMKAQLKDEPSVKGNYTTKNQGMSVEVRTYINREEGAHQRGNKSTFPGSGKVYKYITQTDNG